MLGEIGCVRWVSGLPCPQRSRACQGEIQLDLRYRLSTCLSSLHLLALQVSRSFRGDMEIVSHGGSSIWGIRGSFPLHRSSPWEREARQAGEE